MALVYEHTIHWQFMTIHGLWNSIIFLNSKASLVITPLTPSVIMTHCVRKSICSSPLTRKCKKRQKHHGVFAGWILFIKVWLSRYFGSVTFTSPTITYLTLLFTTMTALQKWWKCFLFHLKRSFRSQDI